MLITIILRAVRVVRRVRAANKITLYPGDSVILLLLFIDLPFINAEDIFYDYIFEVNIESLIN